MRIAFVGKGGSGKTTLSALFTQFHRHEHPERPLLVVDADLNIHLPELIGIASDVPETMHISHPQSVATIKSILKGDNDAIRQLSHFRKTTPPNGRSGFIRLHDPADPILTSFGFSEANMRFMVVGTYDTDDIGSSCYHNNLAVFENILSHLIDHRGTVVADMVAGVDAFANTLHAQFDLLVLVVEPTRRGMEVLEHYRRLAEDAGVGSQLVVVANKVRNDSDRAFIQRAIPKDILVGSLAESDYLRRKDQEGGALDFSLLEPINQDLIRSVYAMLASRAGGYQERLRKLWALHRTYVARDFIRERFGDLSGQIDETFDFDATAALS